MHPGSEPFLDEFDFYKLHSKTITYFFSGEQHLYTPDDFQRVKVDPIAKSMRQIINRLHQPQLRYGINVLARAYASVEPIEYFVYHVDSLGFNILCSSENAKDPSKTEWSDIRLPFPYTILNPELVINAISESIENALSQQDREFRK